MVLERQKTKKGESRALMILYQLSSASAFERAVRALKEAGLEEGLHFTAKRPEEGKPGYIYLKIPAGLWRLVELERAGVDWAKKALNRLEEIARARGFSDLLEEYLRPAREAGIVDPRGMVAEDRERGTRAVVRYVKLRWEEGRPKVMVEYEASGRVETFSFTWYVTTGGRIRAGVRLNDERAAVLSALVGDESLRGKKAGSADGEALVRPREVQGGGLGSPMVVREGVGRVARTMLGRGLCA